MIVSLFFLLQLKLL
jgi:hypothetical protein